MIVYFIYTYSKNKIYLYDVNTGKISKRWKTTDRVIHLLRILNPMPPYEFAYTTLKDSAIRFIGTKIRDPVEKSKILAEEEKKEDESESHPAETGLNMLQDAMEEVMRQLGDKILHLMHKQNYMNRVHGSASSFMDFIGNSEDEECKEIHDQVF